MVATTEELLQKALQLPFLERAGLAERLLESLETVDASIDSAWKKEVEARIGAWRAGKLKTVSISEVLAKYGK